MENEKLSFNIGDLVVLKDSFIQNIVNQNGEEIGKAFYQYRRPQEIQDIYLTGLALNPELIIFSSQKKMVYD